MTAGGTTDIFELGRALAVVLDNERPRAIVTHSLGFPIALQALTVGAAAPPTWVALVPGRKMSHALARFGVKRRAARRRIAAYWPAPGLWLPEGWVTAASCATTPLSTTWSRPWSRTDQAQ